MNTKCSQIRANNVVHLQLKVLRFIFVMLKFHSAATMNQERLLDYNYMEFSNNVVLIATVYSKHSNIINIKYPCRHPYCLPSPGPTSMPHGKP